jgi:hypothetical protein
LSLRTKSLVSLGALAGLCIFQPACNGEDDVAEGSAEGINQTTQALTAGEVESVNGTFGAGCTDRSGAWSLEIAVGAVLDNPELSVVLNDVGCVLTMTELHTTAGIIAADPPIVLGNTYAVAASSFESPVEFYANARLSSVLFAEDFGLTVLYSDDPALANDSNTAAFGVVESTATAESVPAPDYSLSLGGITLVTDAADLVTEANGDATLTEGLIDGEGYVLVAGGDLDTYAELDAAYIGGSPEAVPATLSAALDFLLVGDDLSTPQVQTLIIANLVDGVRSYQAFTITFNPAP